MRSNEQAPAVVRRALLFGGAAAALALPRLAAGATAWPDRPIRMVIPFPAGGASDAVGRLMAQRMGALLAQPIVVENRGGSGGGVGADAVAKAPADGHTVLMATVSTHAVIP